jgi:adenylate cyclase
VIGFDIGFSEPDENSELGLVRQLSQTVDTLGIRDGRLAAFIRDRERAADNDQALARAIRSAQAPVVLGYFFHMSPADLGYPLEQDELERRLRLITGSKYPMVMYRQGADPSSVSFIRAYAPESNLEMLSTSAAGSGYFSVTSDPDGVVRWMPLVMQAGDDIFPPLSVLCAWHYLGRPPLSVKAGPHGVDGVEMGERLIPTDEHGRLLVNYVGPPRSFPHVSVTDILAERHEKGALRDRIVLVGATAIGTHDLRSTPLSPVYPGVEIHATVIDNILRQAFLEKPDWSRVYDLTAIVVLALLIGLVVPRVRAITGIAFAAGLFALYILFARWMLGHAHLWLDVVYPLLALSLNYIALTVYSYLSVERQRRQIKDTFGQYVAPIVVEQMLQDPGRLRLGGEEKVLTVLFSDLEGFTSYSERYPPHEMSQILSDYYDRMTEQIFANRGTLKEYVADELMAIFGAPLEQPDHATRACAAALAMRDARRALGSEWAKMGRPRLQARTGINSGPMLVGNLGSSYRFAYGVLGDHVNLASRLEGLNRVYGTEILMGENTVALLDGSFLVREIDMVRVKGRTQAARIYELVAAAGADLPAAQDEALRLYVAALEAYRKQLWGEAFALFSKALAVHPEDGPSRTMAGRCRAYQAAPPADDWDGTYEQLVKA